jgi:hypothetical protein
MMRSLSRPVHVSWHRALVALTLGCTACVSTTNGADRGQGAAAIAGSFDHDPGERDLFKAAISIGESSMRPGSARGGYRIFGRLLGSKLHVDEIDITQQAVDRVLRSKPGDQVADLPSNTHVGVGHAVAGLPPEIAIWLSLSSLFRQRSPEPAVIVKRRGHGTLIHQEAGKDQGGKDSAGTYSDLSAKRSLVRFRVSNDITCSGQFKHFQIVEKTYVSPADRADEQWRKERADTRSQQARREEAGLAPKARGQLLLEMVPVVSPPGGWALRLHIASDVRLAATRGEVIDQSLRCFSPRPLYASNLRGYQWRIEQTPDRGFQAHIWRRRTATKRR